MKNIKFLIVFYTFSLNLLAHKYEDNTYQAVSTVKMVAYM